MSPARYEVRVAGLLSDDVAADFTEFTVQDAPAETVMYGEIVDDAHLHGVLARLQALGLQVTSLRTVPE
ncbi:hypothetical protein Acsp06_40390 [Actinomycetospora sp. NBRC 106375]|uniref:hypothetical protein n=1 Tax=Actinomycetospora sp. NBRC 106375 TaxID=3032207 RepID=UPI0024A2B6B9|nr:hypothetical protein [Actinomycetospora sp. NBRC 106375]GLZ47854.1 hypothetical protein Acsp06_40390 [Actinomycetospora sp. NBRC 106375]